MHTNEMEPAAAPRTERLISTTEAEQILGVHAGFLNKDRVGKARIPFVRIGRSVRYRRADVEAFIAANLRKSTSDSGAGR